MFITASRPKVHRLPALPPSAKPAPVFPKKQVVAGAAALALVVLAAFSGHLFSQEKPHAAAAPAVQASAEQSPAAEEKTIVLRNENQMIIGQMAHIASPASPPPEVSTMSAPPDKRRGQELLSIINQY